MSGIKLSIIIPIYNSSSTLNACIESILAQTYTNIEIILINDGSNDDSLNICYYHANKHKNIKVINKHNEGVSSSRNCGIELATGEYIQFIDSDDYIDSNMCKSLMEKINAHNADLVICGYRFMNIKKNSILENIPIDKVIEYKDFNYYFGYLYEECFINSPCNKIYKKKLMLDKFNNNLSLGEDLLFNLLYIKKCNKIVCVNESYYNYRVGNGKSLSSQYRDNSLEINILLYQECKKFLEDNYGVINDKTLKSLHKVLVKNLVGSIQLLIECNNKDYTYKVTTINKWLNDVSIQEALLNLISEKKIINLKYIILKRNMVRTLYLLYITKKHVKILLNKLYGERNE